MSNKPGKLCNLVIQWERWVKDDEQREPGDIINLSGFY